MAPPSRMTRRRASRQTPRLLPLILLVCLLLAIPFTVATTTTTTGTKKDAKHKHRLSPAKKHRHAARRRPADTTARAETRDLSAFKVYAQSLGSGAANVLAQTFALKVGGVRFDDNLRSLAVDADGVSYVYGEFSSPTMSMGGVRLTNVGTTNLADSKPSSDIFLARIGRGGTLDWMQGWGGAFNEFAGEVVVDSTGTKLFIVGGFESGEFFLGPADAAATTSLYRDAPVMDDDYADDDEEEEGGEGEVGSSMFFAEVVARTGEVLWAYDYGEGKGVAVASDEVQVCLVGMYSSWDVVDYAAENDDVSEADKAHQDTLLTCMATGDGTETWARSFVGNGNDVPTDLVMENPAGGRGGGKPSAVYLAGTTNSPLFLPIEEDYNITQPSSSIIVVIGFVTKFEGEAGGLLWNKPLGALSSPHTTLKLAVDPSSSSSSSSSSPAIYVTGSFLAPALLTLAGSTNGRTSPATLLKLDGATGNVLWAKALPNAQHVAADYLNNVYVTGTFKQSYAFSPTRTLPAVSTTTGDMYMTKMNGDDGVVTYAKAYGSGSSSSRFTTTGLALDGQGNIYFAGNYTSTSNAVALDSKTVSASGGTTGVTDSFVTRVMIQSFTRRPTPRPTPLPTLAPTMQPTTAAPSLAPSIAPSLPPSFPPSLSPTQSPTTAPPTLAPSSPPTLAPSSPPSLAPTLAPSAAPSLAPSLPPSTAPTNLPLTPPSRPRPAAPRTPSRAPTRLPTRSPTRVPTTLAAVDSQHQTRNTSTPTRRPSKSSRRFRWGS